MDGGPQKYEKYKERKKEIEPFVVNISFIC